MVREKSEIRCPSCRKAVETGGEHFPFCSERCRFVDLSCWLEESYRIPAAPSAEDFELFEGAESHGDGESPDE